MKESGGGPSDPGGIEGGDGSARLAEGDSAERGRPSSLAVSAEQLRLSQQKRKIGIPAMDRLSSTNNNLVSIL